MRLSLPELLLLFHTNEIATALSRAGIHASGTKLERIERLGAIATDNGLSARQVLDHFGSEALRRVAARFGIRAALKAGHIAGLADALTVPFPPAPPVGARSITEIRDFVQSLAGAPWDLASEADAEWLIAVALAERFADVRTQAPVPGHFGHRIDIDIQSGRFGVEVKHAPALIESSSEAYRLLGQAFYYDRRRYAGRLLVVVAGHRAHREHAVISEVFDLLSALAVSAVYVHVR